MAHLYRRKGIIYNSYVFIVMERESNAVLLHVGNIGGQVTVSLLPAGYRRGWEGTLSSDPPFYFAHIVLSRWILYRTPLAILPPERFDARFRP